MAFALTGTGRNSGRGRAKLPDFPLDGELWGGRKKFQRTVSVVRRQDRSDDWKEMLYVVFDAPRMDAPFEARIAHCKRYLDSVGPPYARAHPHRECRGTEHLQLELKRVEGLGGEGLMLRKPGSKYEVGRSSTLLKVKTFKDDEATVVGHLAGAGRHKGRLGALEVKLKDGTLFSVGTGFSDAERAAPPPLGSLITFRYQELSEDGVPRFPSFVRVRTDVAPTASVEPARKKAAPAAKNVVAAPKGPAGPRRRFEFVEGSSSKFWEIELSGNQHTVRFGRIGTDGQEKTKTFADASAASNDAAKLVQEKTKKGYAEK
jgi:DNA ligase 1